MAKDRFISEKELVKHLPVLFTRQDGRPFTEEDLEKVTDVIEKSLIVRKAKELDTDRPNKVEVEKCLQIINDAFIFLAMRFPQSPVPEVVKTLAWLKKDFNIRDK